MNNTPIAQNRDPHHINFDEKYPSWGNGGAKTLQPVSDKHINAAKTGLQDKIPSEFKLSFACTVSHYQGPVLDPINAVLIRFTPDGHPNIGGEHISAVINLGTYNFLGYCRMLAECIGTHEEQIDPKTALQIAFSFLKKEASDLITIDQCPTFEYPDDYRGAGISFDDKQINLGKVSVHWIDAHFEKFHDGSSKKECCGMKVKMRFNDDSERYAWVIVDKKSQVHVFERNVFWDFEKVQRETQMWLHDGWLMNDSEITNYLTRFCT